MINISRNTANIVFNITLAGEPIDLSSVTGVDILFKGPGNVYIMRLGSATSAGISYTTSANDFQVAGQWSAVMFINVGKTAYTTESFSFNVN